MTIASNGQKQAISKNFFLISFIPAIAYWYLDANYSLVIALVGGLLLSLIELIVEKILTKHLHSMSKINFFLILFLGVISLLAGDGLWFKLQPALTGIGIGLFIGIKSYLGVGPLEEMMNDMNQKNLPQYLVKVLERDVAIFFTVYGLFMVVVAISFSSSIWLFFKTGGFYLVFVLFFIIEMILIRGRVKRETIFNQRRQLLASLKITQDHFDKS